MAGKGSAGLLGLCLLALGAGAPAGAAAAGGWSKGSLEQAVEDGGIVAGWDAAGRTFGFCAWVCESRMDEHNAECFAGAAKGGQATRLKAVSVPKWVGLKLQPTAAASLPRAVGRFAVGATATLDEDAGECAWSLDVSGPDGARARVAADRSSAFEECLPSAYVSPDGGHLAVAVTYAEDHGCGDVVGFVVPLPGGAAMAFNVEGLRLHGEGKWREAIPLYQAALELDPTYHVARYNKACAHALLGEAEAAAADVRALLAADRRTFLKRIRKDRDFDKVRAHPSFTAALGG